MDETVELQINAATFLLVAEIVRLVAGDSVHDYDKSAAYLKEAVNNITNQED